MSLVSEEGCARIEAAIKRAETQSSTEFVVAVLPRSSDYVLGPVLVAAAWALGSAFVLGWFVPELPTFDVVALQVPIALATFFLFRIPALRRLLVPKSRAEEQVQRRAFALFSERGLHRTRDASGMLILVSELEHKVVLLGDRGIHANVGDAGWKAHVDHIVTAIRRGDTAQGIVDVIERLSAVHAEHLTTRPDDENELSNAVLRD
jgi:putative membrane protein